MQLGPGDAVVVRSIAVTLLLDREEVGLNVIDHVQRLNAEIGRRRCTHVIIATD